VEEEGSLVKHTHWALSVSDLEHVLELSHGGQLSALSWLVEDDHASEESPEDLGHDMIVLLCLRNENLFQVEKQVLRLGVLLQIELDLGVIK